MAAPNRTLTQTEIDALYKAAAANGGAAVGQKVAAFDFRRPDRIAKSQLRAINALHEVFAHSLMSSLSAFLRSYVVANLISVEQISCAEFLEGLSTPTCALSLGLQPYDGNGILEVSPTLVFPIIELLMGGDGRSSQDVHRALTEVEQKVLDGFFRILLHDLTEAWKGVSAIEFSIQAIALEPQLLQSLAPSEAVVAVGCEVRIGENVGMLNIAIPSIVVKMMRQNFDHQLTLRRTQSTEADQSAMLSRLQPAKLSVDVRLLGPTLAAQDLLRLQEGDVLGFDYPTERPLTCLINGRHKFNVRMVRVGKKVGLAVD